MHRFTNTIRTLGKQPPCRALGQNLSECTTYRRSLSDQSLPASDQYAAKDVEDITWSNFEQGRWPEFPYAYQSYLDAKQPIKSELLAAQSELDHSQNTHQSLDAHMIHYKAIEVGTYSTVDEIYKLCARTETLRDILESGPPVIGKTFKQHTRYMRRDYNGLINLVKRLRTIQKQRRHLQYLPLYGKHQVTLDRLAQSEHSELAALAKARQEERVIQHVKRRADQAKAKAARKEAKAKAAQEEATQAEVTQTDATQTEATQPEATQPEASQSEVTQPKVTEAEAREETKAEATEAEAIEPAATDNSTTDTTTASPPEPVNKLPTPDESNQAALNARLQNLVSLYNAQPHLWAIDPISSAIKKASAINANWIYKQSGAPSPVRDPLVDTCVALKRLRSEHKVLQFYILQHHPHMLTERRIELGKGLFAKMSEGSGISLGDGGEKGDAEE
jgi:chemotaxis protein histidine kinase CheA